MVTGGDDVQSWGRYPRLSQARQPLWWTGDPWFRSGGSGSVGATGRSPLLPRGLGRSYGDSCLAAGGTVLDLTACDRLLAFDAATGILTAEGGASLGDIAAITLPHGWYPPVMAGTRHVTLGGAIANDIHGKNHWSTGTFGCHVQALDLVRSDRAGVTRFEPGDPLFAATIGGLGLTGVIARATIALCRVPGPGVAVKVATFTSWAEYFARAEEETRRHAYSVEWFAPSRGGAVRGVFKLGDPAPGPAAWNERPRSRGRLPFDLPRFATGRTAIAAFNGLYFAAHARGEADNALVSVWPFMHPLDGIDDINRIYGRDGFLQYQFVAPRGIDRTLVPEILKSVADAGWRVFLPILKQFGPVSSPGILSFPLPGTSVAMDFPWQGESLLRFLDELDARVAAAGGRVYIAKDARMSPASFRRFYPRWEEVEQLRDPALCSHFWQRVTEISP